MAAHTPLPPNLRWGLAVFSSSLFINNKTWDSGAAHTYHPGTGSRAQWQRGWGGGFGCCFITVSLLSTSPGCSGASELGAPKGYPHRTHPMMRGSKNKCICCKQPVLLPSCPPWCGRGHRSPSTSCKAGAPSGQRDPGGAGQPAHPCLPCLAHEVLASLPLQMMLYFNVYYFPVWCLAEGMMLQLKVLSRGARGVCVGVSLLLAQPPWACRGHIEQGRGEPLQS